MVQVRFWDPDSYIFSCGFYSPRVRDPNLVQDRRTARAALALTALVRLVRVVEAVVVVVADVDPGDKDHSMECIIKNNNRLIEQLSLHPPGYAVAVGAGEEVPEAGAPLRVALLLVGAVGAVLVAVAVPRGRDAAVVGAAERVRRACPGQAFIDDSDE